MHEDAPNDLQDGDGSERGIDRYMAVSGTIDADICRSQDSWFLVQVGNEFPLIPDVVAHRNHIGPCVEEFLGQLGCQAASTG